MWTDRFDDKVKAEGIVVRDYPLLLLDRGFVIFASRDAKTPLFGEIVAYWASKGSVYCPEPSEGGWGKFVRTELNGLVGSRKKAFDCCAKKRVSAKKQLRKGGRGWLHT